MVNLLEIVKNYLDVTWVDPDADLKLNGIIDRGKRYIDRIAGEAMDYETPDKAQELLLEYCRYARSNALEMFAKNFQHELNGFSLDKEVEHFEIDTANDTDV